MAHPLADEARSDVGAWGRASTAVVVATCAASSAPLNGLPEVRS